MHCRSLNKTSFTENKAQFLHGSYISSQGNVIVLANEAADVELEHKEVNAVDAVEDKKVDIAPVELGMWQGTGYTMPKKKTRGWRHTMMALFSSCCKTKNNNY